MKYTARKENFYYGTGIFTAPRPGKYFFGFSGVSNTNAARIDLQLNGVKIGEG
jgi:hypothetical protein